MRIPRFAPLLAALGFGPDLRAADPLPATPGAVWVRNLFDSMRTPVPPRRLAANLYYVGTAGVSSYLITTARGHILLDTGFEDTVPVILKGIETLGFRAADIKLILSSHAHIDHTGGHAMMKRATGAAVVASAADAQLLESGGADDFLAWPRETLAYEPVKVDQVVADREVISLGGINLTAHLTPGHTKGATTWTMELTDGGRTYHVVFFSSATVNDGTRLVGNAAYPGIVADLEASFARFKALRCDIFLAPHGGQFALADKFARLDRGEGVAALVDPAGWQRLVAQAEKTFRDLLARETALQKP